MWRRSSSCAVCVGKLTGEGTGAALFDALPVTTAALVVVKRPTGGVGDDGRKRRDGWCFCSSGSSCGGGVSCDTASAAERHGVAKRRQELALEGPHGAFGAADLDALGVPAEAGEISERRSFIFEVLAL